MTELLAPAGSYESLIAAVNAGADAVYMGGDRFGARAYADNPGRDRFIEGLHYAHRNGVKVYMTVNTLFKQEELDQLAVYLRPYYEEGVDAVLVQDMGALSLIRHEFPDLPLHASTQMAVTGVYGARFMKQLGLTRIVPARELSLEEIKSIKQNVDIEIETFVHGALCYSYSGRCLMSSLIGGRSGNRGRCAQPCRLDYRCETGGSRYDGNILSMGDLCALSLLPQLMDAGIDSFKIEGRMKSPRYTAGVVEIWRRNIDRCLSGISESFKVRNEDMEQLADLFDRGGCSCGYYGEHNGPGMMAWDEKRDRRDNNALYDRLDREYVNTVRPVEIKGRAIVKSGCPMKLEIAGTAPGKGMIRTVVKGQIPENASGRPASSDDILKQLYKTGGTPYVWSELKIELDDGLFIPVRQLNELRRNAIDELERRLQDVYRRTR